MLYNIIIAPIEKIVSWVFYFIERTLEGKSSFAVICAIIGVSIAINFLALPLYNIADALQEKERSLQKKMEGRLARIKKAFKGDERFMMISTYYRENGYHPLYALRSSLSILIEIPFFIAAYHFLSHCELLKNVSFFIFKDLGSADHLFSFSIAGKLFYINVLPILMTAINLVSAIIYTKGFPIREKLQTFVLAAVFLVLLYNSPSGLVFYWILNNLFSLAKNVVLKTGKGNQVVFWCIGAVLLAGSILLTKDATHWKAAVLMCANVCYFISPFVYKIISKRIGIKFNFLHPNKSYLVILILAGLASAILAGLVLPSSTIATSPIEFSYLGNIAKPTAFVWSAFWTFTGFFVFWPVAVYKMFGINVKKWLPLVMLVIFVMCFLDAFIFKGEYGNLNAVFDVENIMTIGGFSVKNLCEFGVSVLSAICFILLLLRLKANLVLQVVLFSVCLGLGALSATKLNKINKVFEEYSVNTEEARNKKLTDKIEPVYNLSKTGKNVIVLFLDRAISVFLTYAVQEIPELKDQLAGFSFYPNTVSFGTCTDQGSPAMVAGYEYSMDKINARKDELLKDKHNEAWLVMPRLFADAGYEVTITDPSEPNYSWKGDLSAFKKYPEINVREIEGKYLNYYSEEKLLQKKTADLSLLCKTSIVDFSMVQILPAFIRCIFYKNCKNVTYRSVTGFAESFSSLYCLPEITQYSSSKNTFTFIENDTTHNPEYLNPPFYDAPAESDADKAPGLYGVKDDITAIHYHAFVAALKQAGKWFDELRKNGVYDNTRIIIVADHGRNIQLKELEKFTDKEIACFLPLLMVKDFDSNKPLSIKTDFMTNADTIFAAKKGLGLSDINPFTGKELKQQKENGVNVYYNIGNNEWNPTNMTGKKQFSIDDKSAYHVNPGNIFDPDNWIPLDKYKAQQAQKEAE